MIKNSHLLSLLIFILFSLSITKGQDVHVREFDKEKMETYAEDRAFDYMAFVARPPSLWERLSWWLQNIIQEIFLNPNTPWLSRILYYMVLLLIVGAAIFYIIKLRYGGVLSPDVQRFRSSIGGMEQAKSENFDVLINDALADLNYKLAIRYTYLKTLLSLSKRNLISLKDWKSPYDYGYELKGDASATYSEMARLFEYVWYGDFEAGKKEFDRGTQLSGELERL